VVLRYIVRYMSSGDCDQLVMRLTNDDAMCDGHVRKTGEKYLRLYYGILA